MKHIQICVSIYFVVPCGAKIKESLFASCKLCNQSDFFMQKEHSGGRNKSMSCTLVKTFTIVNVL